jgi:hypothetical protein
MGGVMSERISMEEFRKLIGHHGRKTKGSRNHYSGKVANVERLASDGLASTYAGTAFDSPVSCFVFHYRAKLCDPGGISNKAFVDGVVAVGVLRDDSLKEIHKEIREEQFKVKSEAEEKTQIVMREVQPEGRLI